MFPKGETQFLCTGRMPTIKTFSQELVKEHFDEKLLPLLLDKISKETDTNLPDLTHPTSSRTWLGYLKLGCWLQLFDSRREAQPTMLMVTKHEDVIKSRWHFCRKCLELEWCCYCWAPVDEKTPETARTTFWWKANFAHGISTSLFLCTTKNCNMQEIHVDSANKLQEFVVEVEQGRDSLSSYVPATEWPIIMIGQDDSVFPQYSSCPNQMASATWRLRNPTLKWEGEATMASAFLNREISLLKTNLDIIH